MEPPYCFLRFVNGVEMAEGVQIDHANSLAEAMRKAAAICPVRPGTVLVFEAALSEPRIESAASSAPGEGGG